MCLDFLRLLYRTLYLVTFLLTVIELVHNVVYLIMLYSWKLIASNCLWRLVQLVVPYLQQFGYDKNATKLKA